MDFTVTWCRMEERNVKSHLFMQFSWFMADLLLDGKSKLQVSTSDNHFDTRNKTQQVITAFFSKCNFLSCVFELKKIKNFAVILLSSSVHFGKDCFESFCVIALELSYSMSNNPSKQLSFCFLLTESLKMFTFYEECLYFP